MRLGLALNHRGGPTGTQPTELGCTIPAVVSTFAQVFGFLVASDAALDLLVKPVERGTQAGLDFSGDAR